jgi:SAM-dependent methyltransferase
LSETCKLHHCFVSDTSDRLRRTFNFAAETYDEARPAYPSELFDDLVHLASLERGDRLLEIGCATGKATRPLLERGFTVVCIEIGAQLAERARTSLAGLPAVVHVAPFEEWQGPSASFDLVYAATAWHWVEPSLRYQAAHRLLRAGGHLALWSAQHAFPPRLRSVLHCDPGGVRRDRREPSWRVATAATRCDAR